MLPSFEILELTDRNLRLSIRDGNIGLVNAIRRASYEIPSLAIDVVEVHTNTTMMNDEMLYHRLSMLPLRFDMELLDKLNFPANSHSVNDADCCTCQDGCEKCRVELKLQCKNEGDETIAVTSKHLMFGELKEAVTVVDSNGPILLLKVGKHQEISLTAWIRKGTAQHHAKFSPFVISAYRQEANIVIDPLTFNQFTKEEKQHVANCCPPKVFSYDESKDVFAIEEALNCTFCKECIQETGLIAKKRGLPMTVVAPISVTPKPDRFIYAIETTGTMSPLVILNKAIGALKDRVAELQRLNAPLLQLQQK